MHTGGSGRAICGQPHCPPLQRHHSATLGQEDLEEVFTWARFFNETGISAKLMNHPLTKLCEKLFDEHRLMDFHRCVLDVDYRKLLLNELAHN